MRLPPQRTVQVLLWAWTRTRSSSLSQPVPFTVEPCTPGPQVPRPSPSGEESCPACAQVYVPGCSAAPGGLRHTFTVGFQARGRRLRRLPPTPGPACRPSLAALRLLTPVLSSPVVVRLFSPWPGLLSCLMSGPSRRAASPGDHRRRGWPALTMRAWVCFAGRGRPRGTGARGVRGPCRARRRVRSGPLGREGTALFCGAPLQRTLRPVCHEQRACYFKALTYDFKNSIRCPL